MSVIYSILIAFFVILSSTMLQAENVEEFANSVVWRKQLFYIDRLFRPQSSMMRKQDFFFAKNGRKDPKAELLATAAAFNTSTTKLTDEHPICRFPGRFVLIQKHAGQLLTTKTSLIDISTQCPAYSNWKKSTEVSGVSLVFSSYYVNNPGSSFGHTLLRLHRTKSTKMASSHLLDYAVNFAANPTTKNPILYPLLGLMGGFEGTFSLMPYYVKIQEYNNFESRDLWEYELNVSDEGLQRMLLLLWEVGQFPLRYYYLDENCSLVLLLLLESAMATNDLTSDYHLYAVPSDTVKSAVDPSLGKNWIKNIAYRPSALTRYKDFEKTLSSAGVRSVEKMLGTKTYDLDLNDRKIFSEIDSAHVMDAMLELIDFKDKTGGTSQANSPWIELRGELLKHRAAVNVKSVIVDVPDNTQRPDVGHYSWGTGLSLNINSDRQLSSDLIIQPALQNMKSPPYGYAADMQVMMFGFSFREYAGPQKIKLQSYDIFNVMSFPVPTRVLTPPSWSFAINGNRMVDDDFSPDECMTHQMRGGFGYTLGFGSSKYRAFGQGTIGAQSKCFSIGNAALKPGLWAGLFVDPSAKFRWMSSFRLEKIWYYQKHNSEFSPDFLRTSEMSFAYLLQNQIELRLELERISEKNLAKLVWMAYW